tara:strand:- start:702 stop:989 length:288 start_codon:yes stop_codon:yes gene_type:complete
MNMRDANKLQPGAIVRESFQPDSMGHPIHGIIIGKKHVKERHTAKVLGGSKEERYDIVVHWTCKDTAVPRKRWGDNNHRLQVRQNWELMVVSHAE